MAAKVADNMFQLKNDPNLVVLVFIESIYIEK